MSDLTPATNTLQGARPQSYFAQLQPASFRGVSFGTLGGQARFGRRNALHEYPFRDTCWVEDLGRQSRRIQITGFVVGDDVIAQRDRLIAVCEEPGDGELVHPTFGRLQVALMEFSTAEHWEQGRVFECNFTFLEQGQRLFPGTSAASVDAVKDAAGEVAVAASSQWRGDMRAYIAQSAPIAVQIAGVAQAWITAGLSSVNSATGLMNLATSAVGNFGRLLGQASGLVIGTEQVAAAPFESLFGAAAQLRSTVASVAYQVTHSASNLEAGSLAVFAGLSSSFAAAVRGACFTPADALRSLASMMALGGSMTPTGLSSADFFRRQTVCELANASAQYQPSTSSEAAAIRTRALLYIDAEILTAGNQGNDGVYAALRALRAQVVLDMNAKGARLPTLVKVTTPTPMPALALAQRLYRDQSRETELVRRANPIHPAFMPVFFEALKS